MLVVSLHLVVAHLVVLQQSLSVLVSAQGPALGLPQRGGAALFALPRRRCVRAACANLAGAWPFGSASSHRHFILGSAAGAWHTFSL